MLTWRFLARWSLLSPSSSSSPEVDSSAASWSRNSQRHCTGRTSKEPSLDWTRSASHGIDWDEAWEGQEQQDQQNTDAAHWSSNSWSVNHFSLNYHLGSFCPSLCSSFRGEGASLTTAHLSLNDVEKKVRMATAAQEVAQAKRLVQAFHLLQDMWRRSARGAPAKETAGYPQADRLSLWSDEISQFCSEWGVYRKVVGWLEPDDLLTQTFLRFCDPMGYHTTGFFFPTTTILWFPD